MSCQYAFTGIVEAVGGLSLQPIFSSNAYGVFEIARNNYFSQPSKLSLIAGAAGTIITNSLGTGVCSGSMELAYLNVSSWSKELLVSNYNIDALVMIRSSLNSSIASMAVQSTEDTIAYCVDPSNATNLQLYTFDFVVVTNYPVSLVFYGIGNVSVDNFISSSGSVIKFQGGSRLGNPQSLIQISGFQMELSATSGLQNLSISNSGRLYLGQTAIQLSFDQIYLSNSSITSASSIVNANQIVLSFNSSINTDAQGYMGGYPGSAVPSGQGPGNGSMGSNGGNGGSHGGLGLHGLDALNEYLHLDQPLGASSQSLETTINGSIYTTGIAYDTIAAPSLSGSGGGQLMDSPYGRGGNGGGILVIKAQSIVMDTSSRISADGESVYEGGGGGAGGSIWIQGNGTLLGPGNIHANGGTSCMDQNCSPTVGSPGGGGGGGLVRIDLNVSGFTGTISALSGCGLNSIDNLVDSAKGTIAISSPLVSLIHNVSTDNATEYIDIKLLAVPLRLIQTISTAGSGLGSAYMNGTSSIVRGSWTASYRAFTTSTIAASASAQVVQSALIQLGIAHVTVNRLIINNGTSWRITFFDSIDRLTPISVNGNGLYTTDANATITSTILSPSIPDVDPPGIDYAYASYGYSELISMLQFNKQVLGNGSYAFWLDSKTLRIVPNNFTSIVSRISQLAGSLALIKFPAYHTSQGMVLSSLHPVMQ